MSSINPFSSEYRFGNISRYLLAGSTNNTAEEDAISDEERIAVNIVHNFKIVPITISQKEEYTRKRKLFRQKVAIVLAGDDISEAQIAMLWDASRDLLAKDTARILARELLKKAPNHRTKVTSDDPQEAMRFRAVLQMLMTGSAISTGQLAMLASNVVHITNSTVETICREEVTAAYNAKMEAQKVREVQCRICVMQVYMPRGHSFLIELTHRRIFSGRRSLRRNSRKWSDSP
jgi:hypothetical protein